MNLYSKRREILNNALGANSIAIFFSNDKDCDPEYGFSVNRNFYYLTGLDKKDMVLVLDNRGDEVYEYLFIMPYDEVEAKWVGGRLKPEEASKLTEITDIRELSELDDTLIDIIDRSRKANNINVYFDLWHKEQGKTIAGDYAHNLKKKCPNVTIKDIFNMITPMRLIKDEFEVTCIKQAIAITNSGIKAMMKSIRPNMNEMIMEGVFGFALSQNVCNETAFKTIAASGERATILHYSENNQVMKDGELFLQDLGACFKHYCADITRTYPVNGVFSERQKEIYQLVLNAQKLVEANAKAGVNMKDLNALVVKYYENELPKHGLNKGVREYYYHSVSHHLGLDCHDADGGMGRILKAGNIITNEPGLYIADEGIGIRIEDDLLITEDGCINLSSDIIKEVDDIENFMKH